MEDSLIAAIITLALLLTLQVHENYKEKSFNSQIADLATLNRHEDQLHFQDSDFNQIDSGLKT